MNEFHGHKTLTTHLQDTKFVHIECPWFGVLVRGAACANNSACSQKLLYPQMIIRGRALTTYYVCKASNAPCMALWALSGSRERFHTSRTLNFRTLRKIGWNDG